MPATTIAVPGLDQEPPLTPSAKATYAVIVVATVGLAVAFGIIIADAAFRAMAGIVALLAVGYVATILLNRRGRSARVRIERQGDALVFGGSPAGRVLAVALSLVAVAAIAAVYFLTPTWDSMMWIVAIVVVAALVDAGMALRRPQGLYLSTERVSGVATFGSANSAPWNAVEPVVLTPQRLTVPNSLKEIVVGTGQLHSDPRVVAALVDFYRRNPKRRAELATDAVVERLQRGLDALR